MQISGQATWLDNNAPQECHAPSNTRARTRARVRKPLRRLQHPLHPCEPPTTSTVKRAARTRVALAVTPQHAPKTRAAAEQAGYRPAFTLARAIKHRTQCRHKRAHARTVCAGPAVRPCLPAAVRTCGRSTRPGPVRPDTQPQVVTWWSAWKEQLSGLAHGWAAVRPCGGQSDLHGARMMEVKSMFAPRPCRFARPHLAGTRPLRRHKRLGHGVHLFGDVQCTETRSAARTRD